MARNGNNASRDEDWNGFANIRLERQDRKAVKALAETMSAEDVVNHILECLDEGYKVSVSPDYENDAIIVTLTGTVTSVNPATAMSQRHSDFMVAMAASRFAHVELADRGDWFDCVHDWREVDW